MSAHMRSDVWHLHPVNVIVPANHMIESVLPMHCHKWHIIFIVEKKSAIAVNNFLNLWWYSVLYDCLKHLRHIPSSGKSYLANALCICALRQFKTARYMKASQLINELSKAEKLDTYQEELNLFAGYDLLVVDDFGLMNMDVNKCRNLFEVFDSRDPHKSILVISQFPVSSWYDMFQDHTYAEACLARMLSGAYRLEMNGKNMRNMEPINK